ncbi:alpha/beta hydrolase [Nocardia sp. NPDC050712]|uniref:alpha/beta fold hydrolase n=1 Tax=Nocardia sp. NPDC050712 TaxID=3155518 RepID=UPI0033D19670
MSQAFEIGPEELELAYDVRGHGPTLILLHGLVHRRHAWDPVADRLARHRRVVTVDLPGHGDSPDLPDDADVLEASIERLSRFVRAITPAGEKPHLAGNSLGGYLALELACRGLAQSVTALSPAGFALGALDHRRSVAMFTGLRAAVRLLTADRVSAALLRAPLRAALLAAFYARGWKADPVTAAIDVRSLLDNAVIDRATSAPAPMFTDPAGVDCPITIAWGRRDLILPAYQARRARKLFPEATMLTLPGLGHVPMPDDPALIGAILLAGSA